MVLERGQARSSEKNIVFPVAWTFSAAAATTTTTTTTNIIV